jgi:phosphoribosylformylglycinamidine synthase I
VKDVRVMVLAGEGINCEQETSNAFLKAGGKPEVVYVEEWKRNPELIFNYKILALPGGFSFGDELHSGQILALDLKYSVGKELKKFIENKGLIIGICNGFQILMKLGVFEPEPGQRKMTLFHNSSFKFQDRWVQCRVNESKCVWTKNLKMVNLPVRHGEGRILFEGTENEQEAFYQQLLSSGQVALTYSENINGSYAEIAGLTDPSGQILGLMPHPEAALESWLHPDAYAQPPALPLTLFKNAISYAKELP